MEEGRAANKSPHKNLENLAIFFQFPTKQFLLISFKFSCGKLLTKKEGTMLRRQRLREYWYILGLTIQFIFCQVHMLVVSLRSLVSIMTHPPAPTPCVLTKSVFWQKSPAGTGKQTAAKTWFGLEK
jgi:hypothetical protein